MEDVKHRLYQEIIKAKSMYGDIEFNSEIIKLLSKYETKEIVSHNSGSNILKHLEYYLDAKRYEGLSEATIENYNRTIKKMAQYFSNKNVDEITVNDLRSYISSLTNIKNTTKKSKVEQIKGFFAWLKYEDYIHKDPAYKLKPIQVPKNLRCGLTITELEMVRIACKTSRDRALIELLFATGCRVSEIQSLNIQDLNFNDYTIKLIGKGNKERIVCFNEKSALYVKKYLSERTDNEEALFVSERVPYQRLKRRAIGLSICRIKQRVEGNIRDGLYPHKLRHTFATLGIQSGMELNTIQILLGHSSPSTTLIYAQQSMDNVKHNHRQKLVH